MQLIRIFLSSPGDVQAERERVHDVVKSWNRAHSQHLDVELKVFDWNRDAVPGAGDAQEIIDKLAGDYDIYLGILWQRFGKPTKKAGSGTEAEFNNAYARWLKTGKPHILFYFKKPTTVPETDEESEQWEKVRQFKKRLQTENPTLYKDFKTETEFSILIQEHLSKIIYSWFPEQEKPKTVSDYQDYLFYLKNDCTYINIRGLASGEGRAHQFKIDELYIPLKTWGKMRKMDDQEGIKVYEFLTHSKKYTVKIDYDDKPYQHIPLDYALQQKSLVIRGEPGAGKTTFMRLLTYTLCAVWTGTPVGQAAQHIEWPEPPPLPIFVRMGELTNHLQYHRHNDCADLPASDDSAECLLHFLQTQSRENNWHVSADDFRRELENGRCLILLDGLDEAPDADVREQMSQLAENLMKAYPENKVVLTSRPAALTDTVMPAGFSLVDILPLDESAMNSFLTHWCRALYPEAPEKAKDYQNDLTEALQAKPEIRRMARTPVMLTALAVVHWNQHTLPEQRFELYESILTWLFRARRNRPGRLPADRCRSLLQILALAMFTHPNGRQRLVELGWAIDTLAPSFNATDARTAVQQAEYFIRDEMVDSGIIVKRDNALEFWHLSFQEYLAAYQIAGLVEDDQEELLFKDNRIFSAEWREAILLLSGVLYKQGSSKVNRLIDLIIKHTPKGEHPEMLPDQARSVALLGGIQNDLSTLNFQPDNPEFPRLVQRVEGIFDKDKFRRVSAHIRSQAADALALAGDPRFSEIEWLTIPAGEFWMGAQKKDKNKHNYDPDARYNESPVHKVVLSAFQMSTYPVTVAQYKKFVDSADYHDEQYWSAGGFDRWKKPRNWDEQILHPGRPVVSVSWYEAAAFAAWTGGRLPAEAEWEYAARGRDDRKWPWGNDKPDREICNWAETGLRAPSPVGIFPEDVSPFGLMDMAGNVWEWCRDWYSKTCYAQSERVNPPGPKNGDVRVLRGGSWYNSNESSLRCSIRYRGNPDFRYDVTGFRVARSPS